MADENETIEERLARRKNIKKEYGRLFDAFSEILFRHDPAELNYDFNRDEYDSEAETILSRLKDCHSVEDVLIIVREELQKWFDKDTAAKAVNKKIAEEIWRLWQNRK